MDTKYLKYVLTIARKKNMTKAAEELYVSQSSLSQYLSRLEQEIGVPLFIRAKGGAASDTGRGAVCGGCQEGNPDPEGPLP